MTFRSILHMSLKIFSMICYGLWSGFTIAMTVSAMWHVLKGDAPFFQGALYAGLCGLGIGVLITYLPRRYFMKRDCEKAAQQILGGFKSAAIHTSKIREKIKTEFDLMVKMLMEGDTDAATVHQQNLQKLHENYNAVWSEHFSLFDKEEKDESKTSS